MNLRCPGPCWLWQWQRCVFPFLSKTFLTTSAASCRFSMLSYNNRLAGLSYKSSEPSLSTRSTANVLRSYWRPFKSSILSSITSGCIISSRSGKCSFSVYKIWLKAIQCWTYCNLTYSSKCGWCQGSHWYLWLFLIFSTFNIVCVSESLEFVFAICLLIFSYLFYSLLSVHDSCLLTACFLTFIIILIAAQCYILVLKLHWLSNKWFKLV